MPTHLPNRAVRQLCGIGQICGVLIAVSAFTRWETTGSASQSAFSPGLAGYWGRIGTYSIVGFVAVASGVVLALTALDGATNNRRPALLLAGGCAAVMALGNVGYYLWHTRGEIDQYNVAVGQHTAGWSFGVWECCAAAGIGAASLAGAWFLRGSVGPETQP